jgi:hypothetical protein
VTESVVTIASVVEGEGEVRALPKLLYRLAGQVPAIDLRVPQPMRVPRGRLLMAGGIERAVSATALRVEAAGGVLVLLDADDDCPAMLGPELLSRAKAARPDVPVSVVLANREFEAWILAGASSLAGRHGFPEQLTAPPDPESIRGAKERLRHLRDGRTYKPTVDQAPLASALDIDQARAGSPSFAKFCRDIHVLLTAAPAPP